MIKSMKNILSLVAVSMLLPALVCSAQSNHYEVFKLVGTVHVKSADSQWQPLAKHSELSMRSIVRIEANSSVSILDHLCNKIYRSDKTGEISVREIISAARAKEDSFICKTFEQVNENMKKKDSGTGDYSRKGMVYRGENGNSSTAMVYAAILNRDKKAAKEGGLVLKKLRGKDGDFCFRVINNSGNPLYINVICYKEDEDSPSLCCNIKSSAEVPYLIVGEGKTDLEQFRFAEPSGSKNTYLLFASAEPFYSDELQILLKGGRQPSVEPCDLIFAECK